MSRMEVVKWDAPIGVYAHKHRSNNLGSWSQLIVAESQEAILVKEGRMCGPFKAGRHTLDTKNIPVLERFLRIPFTGPTPFTAEVWFVQKAIQLDVQWHSKQPILINDAKYGIALPVIASGQFGIRVGTGETDSKKFIKKLVGTLHVFDEQTLSSYFEGIVLTKVKTLVAKVATEHNVSVLDIATKLETISRDLQSSLVSEFKEYGLELSKFNVTSIETDLDDPSILELKSALSENARLEILGEKYQQVRSFDVMEKAAENQSATGGMLGAGLGVGLGMGAGLPMAQELTSNISNQQQKAPSNESKISCDKCGQIIDSNSKFCPGCGDEVRPCPNCGTDNPSDASECRKCRTKLVSKTSCTECGTDIPANHKFCGNCGSSVDIGEIEND